MRSIRNIFNLLTGLTQTVTTPSTLKITGVAGPWLTVESTDQNGFKTTSRVLDGNALEWVRRG